MHDIYYIISIFFFSIQFYSGMYTYLHMGCNTDGGPKTEAVRGTSDDDTQNITSDVKKK